MVLIYTSSRVNDVEHLFIRLFAIRIFSLVICLFGFVPSTDGLFTR